jgi:ribosomal protein S18 acetylase RimI-like enzyme
MPDFFLNKKTENYYEFLVDGIEVGGAWIGHTDIVPQKSLIRPSDKVLMNFGIKAPFRQKGYAKALIKAIMDNERNQGTTTLRLGVEMNNLAAVKVYKDAGFRTDGTLYKTMYYMWAKL